MRSYLGSPNHVVFGLQNILELNVIKISKVWEIELPALNTKLICGVARDIESTQTRIMVSALFWCIKNDIIFLEMFHGATSYGTPKVFQFWFENCYWIQLHHYWTVRPSLQYVSNGSWQMRRNPENCEGKMMIIFWCQKCLCYRSHWAVMAGMK